MSTNELTRQVGKCSCPLEEHLANLPVSPFEASSRLSYGYTTSTDWLFAVEQFVMAAERAEAFVHEKKRLLGKAIKLLEEQEVALRTSIGAHQTLLGKSALGRMPLEVLGRVFIYAQDDAYINFKPSWPLLPTPISVSQVCQHWRAASLMHPDLWSRICLTANLPWNGQVNHNLLIQQLILCLERSRNHTLAIRIDSIEEDRSSNKRNGQIRELEEGELSDEDSSSEDFVYSQYGRHYRSSDVKPHWGDNAPLALLEAYSSRVSHLEIDLHPESNAWTAIEGFKISFPSLTSLKIFDLGDLSHFWGDFRSLSDTESLTTLTLLRTAEPIKGFTTILPVERLLCLKIEGPTLSDWFRIFERAFSLRELHWVYNYEDSYAMKPDRVIVLLNLWQLVAPNVPGRKLQSSLAKLKFPGLGRLTLNVEVFSTCQEFEFITSDSLISLSLVFNVYVGNKKASRLSKYIKEFLSRLPRLAPKLKEFHLAFDPGAAIEPYPLDNNLHCQWHRGFVGLIESMQDKNGSHFKELEVLTLSDMSFLALHQPLLRLVQEGSLKKLKEVTVTFLSPVASDSLSSFVDQLSLAGSKMGVRIAININ